MLCWISFDLVGGYESTVEDEWVGDAQASGRCEGRAKAPVHTARSKENVWF